MTTASITVTNLEIGSFLEGSDNFSVRKKAAALLGGEVDLAAIYAEDGTLIAYVDDVATRYPSASGRLKPGSYAHEILCIANCYAMSWSGYDDASYEHRGDCMVFDALRGSGLDGYVLFDTVPQELRRRDRARIAIGWDTAAPQDGAEVWLTPSIDYTTVTISIVRAPHDAPDNLMELLTGWFLDSEKERKAQRDDRARRRRAARIAAIQASPA